MIAEEFFSKLTSDKAFSFYFQEINKRVFYIAYFIIFLLLGIKRKDCKVCIEIIWEWPNYKFKKCTL